MEPEGLIKRVDFTSERDEPITFVLDTVNLRASFVLIEWILWRFIDKVFEGKDGVNGEDVIGVLLEILEGEVDGV